MDHSHLDSKYFIDEYVFNCPFCNRRNVQYYVTERVCFNWSNSKECHAYFIECTSCKKESMHLSYEYLGLTSDETDRIGKQLYKFKTGEAGIDLSERELDDVFFYSVPTSLFAIDKRVPRVLRELITEAEGCLKSNFLTGASACARKVIYELAVLEEAEGDNYEERLKSLKATRSDVDPSYFDTLLTIQQVTSSKVHEQAYDDWESKHLRLILSTLTEILQEMYVIPAVKQEKRSKILKLKQELVPEDIETASAAEDSTAG